MRARSYFYYAQRLRLHYVEWGSADAPQVVLVHGMQDHCRTWDFVAERFADRYRVIVPDLRGHGDSDWNRGVAYRHLDYMYDIAHLIRQRADGPCILVGHSLGGAVAALVAGVFPELVERLVLLEGIGLWQPDEPLPTPAERLRGWSDQLQMLADREPRRYETLNHACRRMQEVNPQLTPEVARHLTVHGSHQNEDGSYSWKFDNYTHAFSGSGLAEAETTAIWNAVEAPVLILNADDGLPHRIGQNGTDAHFADVRMQTIDDAGHWLHHDQLNPVTRSMTQFLDAA